MSKFHGDLAKKFFLGPTTFKPDKNTSQMRLLITSSQKQFPINIDVNEIVDDLKALIEVEVLEENFLKNSSIYKH